MTNWFCKGIIVVYFLLTITHAAHAENFFVVKKQAEQLENRPVDNQAIDQLKIYLREIKSIAVDFIQEDSAGNQAKGKLLINKPEFRCNYYPPFPLVVIGNANYVSVYDYDMKHVSRIKAEENVFNFLLEDSIDFDKYFKIESTIDRDNMFEITIYHTLSERRSQITFDKETKQMKMLKILEDDNVITIKFNHIAKVQNFDDDLFKLKHPDIFGAPKRLNKSDIEKKYNLARACHQLSNITEEAK